MSLLNLFIQIYINFTSMHLKSIFFTIFNRGSSVPENDRLASVASELQFRSLSRHSSPTEEREGKA